MLDRKNLDVLNQLGIQMKETEQKRKELAEKAQKQIGATVKLNLKQYRTKDGDVLRDTIDGITYEINPFYNDCTKPGDCFVQVEKVRQDIVLDCKPAPPMKIFEIEDAYDDIKYKTNTADISRLSRTQEKINELLSTLQYYDQRKHIFGSEYVEKVPQYIAKLNELNATIARKIMRYSIFDEPKQLAFKLKGKYCCVSCDGETVAEFTIMFEGNTPAVTRPNISAKGCNEAKLLQQLYGQIGDYLKKEFRSVTEMYAFAESGSIQEQVLGKSGFAKFPKQHQDMTCFYKSL
jgi:hypothetical protein